MIRFRILCTTVDLDFSLINYPEPEIPNSWSNFHLCFIQKIALINIEEASSDRRSEDASYSLQAILSQSKPGQCNHSTFFVNQLKKRSRNKTTGYFEWSLDGNLCFRALFKKIGSVGTPSRFSFLFSRTLCFYSALETIFFFRKSGQGGLWNGTGTQFLV